MAVDSREGEWTLVTIKMPVHPKQDADGHDENKTDGQFNKDQSAA